MSEKTGKGLHLKRKGGKRDVVERERRYRLTKIAAKEGERL